MPASPFRLFAALLMVIGPAAPAARAQTGPALAAWPAVTPSRHLPCSVEWDDLGTPACTRSAFEHRYVRMSELAIVAPSCQQRDEAWARDLVAAIGFLIGTTRGGASDAASAARNAPRLDAARERARAQLARNERMLCDDIWESTRLAHADGLVALLRSDRAVAERCRAGTERGPACERLRNLPR